MGQTDHSRNIIVSLQRTNCCA